jgi:hypothetical protein
VGGRILSVFAVVRTSNLLPLPAKCHKYHSPWEDCLWRAICLSVRRENAIGADMRILPKKKVHVMAEQNGWTLAHAEGYIEGERSRRRGVAPSKFALVGIDDYSLGFRAGYFATDRRTTRQSQHQTK